MTTLVMWIEDRFMDEPCHEKLHKYAGGRELIVTTDLKRVQQCASDVEIVLGDFPREHLSSLPSLAWFQQFGTGVEWLQQNPDLIDASFTLTNCSDGHYDVVADHLMAILLATLRGIPTFVNSQSQSHWLPVSLSDCDSLFQLRGKTVLLVGLGSVAMAIASRLKPFGVAMIGVRKNSAILAQGIDKVYAVEQLTEAARQADIVISCLPGTGETTHLFDQSFFDSIRRPGFFFNVGRGNAVDEKALVRALKSGALRGAGVDVVRHEPLLKNSDLWTTPNLLITPHVGGTYDGVMNAWRDVALENLRLYTTDQELRNVVGKQSGY